MIIREDRDRIAVLRMEHGKVNAIDIDLLTELREEIAGLRDSGADAVVITGTGRNFSAGLDLLRLLEGGDDFLRQLLPALHAALLELYTFPRPTVAAVNGHAIAGGFVLACACDCRVVAEGAARLGITELSVGVPFPAAPLEMVRSVLGEHRCRDLMYSGRLISTEESHALGFADELVEPDGLLDRATEIATKWGASPVGAFELTKRQLQAPVVERLETRGPGIDAEVAKVWADPRTHATIRAFIEKTFGR